MMMIDFFMCQNDKVSWFLKSWSNIILDASVRVFLGQVIGKSDCPSCLCAGGGDGVESSSLPGLMKTKMKEMPTRK